MKPRYERIREIFRKEHRDEAVLMIGFSDKDKSIVDEIIAHNKKCDANVKNNNYQFWEKILEKSNYADDVLYAIIVSPYAPNDIIEKAAQKAMNPKTLVKALGRDIQFEDRTYDLIYKKAKTEISKVLTNSYLYDVKRPLPFSQNAINYYAKKHFEKTNVKNNKMLIMLAYTDDKGFLKYIHKHHLLNEDRLNHLINNENIPEEQRNAMFTGMGYNRDDIIPNYNKINNPTPFMVQEIYLSNIESYFCGYKNDKQDKKIKNETLNRVVEMYQNGWLSPSIEKDIIARYEKGDSSYRFLVKHILSTTENVETIKSAKSLDIRIYEEAFSNEKISQKDYDELAIEYVDRIISSVKSPKRLATGNWNIGKPIIRTPLRRDQYEILANVKDTCINASLVESIYVPEDIMKKLTEFHCEKDESHHYLNIALTAKVNLVLRKLGVEKEDLIEWTRKFVQQYSMYYNIQGIIQYGPPDKDYIKLIESGKFDDFFKEMIDISMSLTGQREQEVARNFFAFARAYEDAYINNASLDPTNHTLSALYEERNEMFKQFRDCDTLGAIYLKIDQYADDLIYISDIIDEKEAIVNMMSKEWR